MKKSTLCIFLILWFCNFINTANAVIKKYAGVGELNLSEKITDGYFDYVTKPLSKLPLVFFVSEDEKDFYSVIISNDGGSYAGSGTIIKKKLKCELKLKKKCNLFSNTNVIVWDNGINPSDPKKSKIDRKISKEDFIIKLTKLGFIINEQQQLIKKKKNAKQKADKEKELAKQKADKEKELAKQKADKEKELAKQKADKEKELAKQKAAEEKLDKKLSLLPAETDLKKAQSFLIDLQNFIKLYPNEFDIIKVSEFFILTRPILDGDLNFKSKKNLELFKEFTNTSSKFKKYYDEIRNNKTEKELIKINEAFLNLEKNIETIKTFLVTEPNSIYMEKWLDSVKSAEVIINDPPNYNQLLITSSDLEEIIKSKIEIDNVIEETENSIGQLKEILKDNFTTDLAPLLIEQVKTLEASIKKQIIEDMQLLNNKVEEFIYKEIVEPEEKRIAEDKRIADLKAEEERKIAEKKAAKERKIAEKKAEKERKIAEKKVGKEKKTSLSSNNKQTSSQQKKFLDIIKKGQLKLKDVETDFQIGAVLSGRDKELNNFMISTSITNWIGTVKKVDSNSDGKGTLSIAFGKNNFYFRTWNNAFSDDLQASLGGRKTLIDPDSDLYSVMGTLRKKDKVKISGFLFIDASSSYLEMQNFTKKGKIKSPEFTFVFDSIEKIN